MTVWLGFLVLHSANLCFNVHPILVGSAHTTPTRLLLVAKQTVEECGQHSLIGLRFAISLQYTSIQDDLYQTHNTDIRVARNTTYRKYMYSIDSLQY